MEPKDIRNSLNTKRESVIVVMLDVQGTLNGINETKAKSFMQQLNELRIKYEVSKVIINVSSQVYSPDALIKYLDILNKYLMPNIILDDATFMYGRYDYQNKQTKYIENKDSFQPYNMNKIACFEKNYLVKYDVVFFAIIDDSVRSDYYKKFKNIRPMIICKPSLRYTDDLKYDNFMCYSSLNYGFDGVLECLDTYLKNIKYLRKEEILQKQKDMLVHLGAVELKMMCIKKQFCLLERYLQKAALDQEDYDLVAHELTNHIKNGLDSSELEQLDRIIELLKIYIEEENEIFRLKKKVNL